MKKWHTKEQLLDDMRALAQKAGKQEYILSGKDVFALGYLCGTYGVKRLLNNEDEVEEACLKYDETDDLGLRDTIGETLMDLGVIKRGEL